MSPLNGFVYLLSRVPSTPFLHPSLFPELAPIKEQWEIIRREAVELREASKIRAAGRYNDIGFNSFFRNGWRRFHLKWYDNPHPSAATLCPDTLAILEKIPTVKAAMFAMPPPGGTLGLHRDPYSGSLRYHLGLVTPNHDDFAIIVDGEHYS